MHLDISNKAKKITFYILLVLCIFLFLIVIFNFLDKLVIDKQTKSKQKTKLDLVEKNKKFDEENAVITFIADDGSGTYVKDSKSGNFIKKDDDSETPTKNKDVETTVKNIVSLSDQYKDDYLENNNNIIFYCEASKFIKDKDDQRYLICLDQDNYVDYVAVNAFNIDPTKVEYGDQIKIKGFVDNVLFGVNIFGVESEVVVVWPIYLTNLNSGYEI